MLLGFVRSVIQGLIIVSNVSSDSGDAPATVTVGVVRETELLRYAEWCLEHQDEPHTAPPYRLRHSPMTWAETCALLAANRRARELTELTNAPLGWLHQLTLAALVVEGKYTPGGEVAEAIANDLRGIAAALKGER